MEEKSSGSVLADAFTGLLLSNFSEENSKSGNKLAYICPLLGEAPAEPLPDTIFKKFQKFFLKSGYHPAQNCPLMGEGPQKGGQPMPSNHPRFQINATPNEPRPPPAPAAAALYHSTLNLRR